MEYFLAAEKLKDWKSDPYNYHTISVLSLRCKNILEVINCSILNYLIFVKNSTMNGTRFLWILKEILLLLELYCVTLRKWSRWKCTWHFANNYVWNHTEKSSVAELVNQTRGQGSQLSKHVQTTKQLSSPNQKAVYQIWRNKKQRKKSLGGNSHLQRSPIGNGGGQLWA